MGVVGSELEAPALPSPSLLQRTGSARGEGEQVGSGRDDGGAAVNPDQPSVAAGQRASMQHMTRRVVVLLLIVPGKTAGQWQTAGMWERGVCHGANEHRTQQSRQQEARLAAQCGSSRNTRIVCRFQTQYSSLSSFLASGSCSKDGRVGPASGLLELVIMHALPLCLPQHTPSFLGVYNILLARGQFDIAGFGFGYSSSPVGWECLGWAVPSRGGRACAWARPWTHHTVMICTCVVLLLGASCRSSIYRPTDAAFHAVSLVLV